MYLHIFIGSPRGKRPFIVETNLDWAVPYWTKRKEQNPDINWVISSSPFSSSYYLS